MKWQDVDFQKATIDVRQRSDRWGKIGSTKSQAGQRTVPVPPVVVNTLKEWKLQCPPGELTFPDGLGNPESYANIINRGLIPSMKKAGLTIDTGKVGEKGEPILDARYSGLHALRHFFASWLINPKEAGDLGLDMKTMQARMGIRQSW